MVSWSHGVMVSWSHGLMVSWSHGVMLSGFYFGFGSSVDPGQGGGEGVCFVLCVLGVVGMISWVRGKSDLRVIWERERRGRERECVCMRWEEKGRVISLLRDSVSQTRRYFKLFPASKNDLQRLHLR